MTGADAATASFWDGEAPGYDLAPDHGLTSPEVRDAWRDLLRSVLPAPPALVADLGCGTGSLARLLVDEGFAVDGADLAPGMAARARVKVPEARIVVADVDHPPFEQGAYDAVLARHVLWTMDDPAATLGRWVELLRPGGTLVLVEGRWSTGVGLTRTETERLVRGVCEDVTSTPLPDPALWGRVITDDRHLVVGR